MLSVQRSTTIDLPLDVAFDYFADFANTASWDPGVVQSTQQGRGPLAAGVRYTILARFGGRKLPMVYEVLSVDAPHRIVLEGRSATSTARDDIRFEDVDGRTKITWRLEVSLLGLAALAEPVIKPLVDRLAKDAIDGIETAAWEGLPQRARHRESEQSRPENG